VMRNGRARVRTCSVRRNWRYMVRIRRVWSN